MGVPPKLTDKWQKALDDYIAQNDPDVKNLLKDDDRVARIAYDKSKNVCTNKLKRYEPVYKIPIKYLWYNAYSARLGQFKETAITLDQEVKSDRNLIQKEFVLLVNGHLKKILK